jgi:hypothetical protein
MTNFCNCDFSIVSFFNVSIKGGVRDNAFINVVLSLGIWFEIL